jgi:methionyl-tRNA formyltransferase
MLKIVFMGTPEFSIPCADLIREEHELLAIVTAADKPAGRGHKLLSPPLKAWATKNNTLTFQPKSLKSARFISQLRALGADLFVVVAFRMLPEAVWSIPPKGTINLHASLLPKYRGAAPIQRAIEQGDKITGLTTFRLTHQIDEGDIILQTELSIGDDETGGELHDRMMYSGAELMRQTLAMIDKGEVKYVKQQDEKASQAPKIFPDDCQVKWDNSIHQVYNQIRAFIPFPGAWFIKDDKKFKILKAQKGKLLHDKAPGDWHMEGDKLFIACKEGSIEILIIQPEAKRPMGVKDFLNGYRV